MPFKFLCCGSDATESDPPRIRPVMDEPEKKEPPKPRKASNTSSFKTSRPNSSAAGGSVPPMYVCDKSGTHVSPPFPADRANSPAPHPPSGESHEAQKCDQIPTDNPPPYHNWQDAVPDTALFPPPPVHGYLYSNSGNASAEDAQRAHDFCNNTPFWNPVKPSAAVYQYVQRGDLRPVRPHEYNGSLTVTGNGRWRGITIDGQGDCLLLTGLPVYFPTEDSPLVTERPKTIYFEVKLIRTSGGSATQTPGFSIGYAAQPYPTWRSPGWERGSVGVFSDDGCRFVNDSWGGREFTSEFNQGETVGLGMTFSLPDRNGKDNEIPSSQLAVEIFLTRNGRKTGSWDLHEPVDADSGSLEGLEGDYDLYGAVGLFGGVEFEVCFDQSGWLWKPVS